jgi:hypothetical protein
VQQWEYLRAIWDGNEFLSLSGLRLARGTSNTNFDEWLVNAGESGWELVTAENGQFIFKRPKE